MKSNYRYAVGILVLALLLRFLGIWHGYPYSYYPDEAHFVKRALSFGSLDFNPHWFHKPAFYMYLLFFEYGILFVVGKVCSAWTSVSEFAVTYINNPGAFYMVGRLSTALFGCATVWTVYRAGEMFFKKDVGLWGALLLTLSYGHIVAGQDIKADVPAAFFAFLSMYCLLQYEVSKQTRHLLASAIVAGIGAATKIYPIIMLAPILTISFLISWEQHRLYIKKINSAFTLCILAFFTFWAAYFVCAPYSFLDPLGRQITFGDFVSIYSKITHLFAHKQVSTVSTGASDFISQRATLGQGFVSYFQVLLARNGLGLIIGGVTLAGMVTLLFSISRRIFIFLLFPFFFIFFSVFTNPGYAAARHQLPAYPFLAIGGGYFFVWLTESSYSHKKRTVALIISVSLCFPLYNIVKRGIFVSKTDTRTLAKNWIEKNIQPGSKIIMDENGPPLLLSKEGISDQLTTAAKFDPKGQFTASYDIYLTYQLQAAKSSITYNYHEIRIPWWKQSFHKVGTHELSSNYDKDMANPIKPVGVNSYDDYVKNNFDYAIVHSHIYSQFLKDNSKRAKNFPTFAQFYEELFKKGALIKEFAPEDAPRPGPTVKIFKISKT